MSSDAPDPVTGDEGRTQVSEFVERIDFDERYGDSPFYRCTVCGCAYPERERAEDCHPNDERPDDPDEWCTDCGRWPADYALGMNEGENTGPLCATCAHERNRLGECDTCGEERLDVRSRPEHPNERLCKRCQRSAAKAMQHAENGWTWDP